LILLAAIEIVAIFGSALIGAVLYFLLILVLILHASRSWQALGYRFFITLALAPLMRVLGLVLFLNYGNLIAQTFFVSIPNFVAVYLVQRWLGMTWQDLGLRFDNWRRTLLIAFSGILIGGVQFLIVQHRIELPSSLFGTGLWILVLLGVAFLEELIFRGLILSTAISAVGVWPGIIFVALLLAVFQIALVSPLQLVFVCLIGVVMGWLVHRTGSIVAVTMAHGLANLMFYLVMPILR
jgi:membrane protease YdiL (CAAX protease family)